MPNDKDTRHTFDQILGCCRSGEVAVFSTRDVNTGEEVRLLCGAKYNSVTRTSDIYPLARLLDCDEGITRYAPPEKNVASLLPEDVCRCSMCKGNRGETEGDTQRMVDRLDELSETSKSVALALAVVEAGRGSGDAVLYRPIIYVINEATRCAESEVVKAEDVLWSGKGDFVSRDNATSCGIDKLEELQNAGSFHTELLTSNLAASN